MGASSDLKQSFKDTLNSLNIMTKMLHATTTPHTSMDVTCYNNPTYIHGYIKRKQTGLLRIPQ
jgi:hypothetical protein